MKKYNITVNGTTYEVLVEEAGSTSASAPVFTAPVAFATGSAQSTGNIFKSWCRMFAGQMFLLVMNAWCLRIFTSMVGTFLSNPLFV